ncbi:hypothetical protein Hanom_Chr14g01267581 [Helianthus anomalus]
MELPATASGGDTAEPPRIRDGGCILIEMRERERERERERGCSEWSSRSPHPAATRLSHSGYATTELRIPACDGGVVAKIVSQARGRLWWGRCGDLITWSPTRRMW